MVAEKNTTDGFTLVEMMITLAISGILIFAIYSAYIIQQRTYYTQDRVIEMQQNIRAGHDILVREIRMAGYDQLSSNVPTILIATDTPPTIQFTQDITDPGGTTFIGDPYVGDTRGIGYRGDGFVSGPNEDITYTLASTTLTRNGQAVAMNIADIEFYYTLNDGSKTLTPGTPANIRSVQISILATASRRDDKFLNTTTYTTGSGAVWGPFNDNIRRRFTTTNVKLRNMGLDPK